jgi:tetratricopeptide (TPR) repeat protein
LKTHSLLVGIISILSLFGCGSGTVEIKTIPNDATISVIGSSGNIRKIGNSGSYGSGDVFKGEDIVQISVSHSDYATETILLSKSIIPQTYAISVKLKKSGSDVDHKVLDYLAKKIAESYQYLYTKDYDQAILILSSLANRYPSLSVVYDFLGNAYYLKTDYKSAFKYYKIAMKLDPSNIERREIFNKLKLMTD